MGYKVNDTAKIYTTYYGEPVVTFSPKTTIRTQTAYNTFYGEIVGGVDFVMTGGSVNNNNIFGFGDFSTQVNNIFWMG